MKSDPAPTRRILSPLKRLRSATLQSYNVFFLLIRSTEFMYQSKFFFSPSHNENDKYYVHPCSFAPIFTPFAHFLSLFLPFLIITIVTLILPLSFLIIIFPFSHFSLSSLYFSLECHQGIFRGRGGIS
jgi:hypothetical protein